MGSSNQLRSAVCSFPVISIKNPKRRAWKVPRNFIPIKLVIKRWGSVSKMSSNIQKMHIGYRHKLD
jgi:hypothetical protein